MSPAIAGAGRYRIEFESDRVSGVCEVEVDSTQLQAVCPGVLASVYPSTGADGPEIDALVIEAGGAGDGPAEIHVRVLRDADVLREGTLQLEYVPSDFAAGCGDVCGGATAMLAPLDLP